MKKTLIIFLKLFLVVLFITGFSLLSFKLEAVSASEVFPFNGIIHADAAVIYGENVKGGAKATELAYGTRVKVNNLVSNQINNYCKNVYEIEYDGKKGYMCSGLLTNIDINISTSDIAGIETYKNYCDALKGKGFPDSYCPYLYYVHSKYPLWEFNPDMINHTIEEVASEEQGKVVLQTANPNYWSSSNPIEGDYYFIKSNVIASFMDPRNSMFLDEIFQYLDLSKSKDIVNDTTLLSISGQNGHLAGFLEDFKKAGLENSINPVHVMARSAQEGTNKSTYSAVKGTYTTDNGKTSSQGFSLDGYYNFFNIGSYASGYYTGTVQRGLAYAAGFLAADECMTIKEDGKGYYDVTKCGELEYGRPWDTPTKAIYGGAEFLAKTYVNKGQNTVYFQKFNVSSLSNSMYTHQYMTNIYAPSSESNKMYNAYNKGSLLNSKFSFLIPVYKNMTDIQQPLDKSGNNNLSMIKVDGKNITGFDKDVLEYQYNLLTSADSFKIEGIVEDSRAKVSGNGTIKFENGVAKVQLVVTSESNVKNIYTIVVNQVKPVNEIKVSDIVSKMGVKINGTIMYGIVPGTKVDTLVRTVTTNKGTASVVDAKGSAKKSGVISTGDKITIKGSKDSITYTIAVRGDIKGDGKISVVDLLKCQKHILNIDILKNELFYAADTNYDGKINVVDLLKIQKHLLGIATL